MAIGDSSAVYSEKRVFSQHQSALTLLQHQFSKVLNDNYLWLDLAAGKGQIISSLEDIINPSIMPKIVYHAFDANQIFLDVAMVKASKIDLKADRFIGQMENFPRLVDETPQYNFVSLINVVHEIGPYLFAEVLFEALIRLKEDGVIYVYDMEAIDPLEVGALPLNQLEVLKILETFYSSLGTSLTPNVSKWQHSTTTSWNFTISIKDLNVSRDSLKENKDQIISSTRQFIQVLIEEKFTRCIRQLDLYTKHQTELVGDDASKIRLLYEFWALNRLRGVSV
ncbi:class I SAM-dependent methyltransferase [Paenibacillus phytohabitans]|uniref:class I SAM-dependent methyltransferase n=1 Tax=Paenibacillus phytohabitans TaxID=2654978 RepID=UPI00300BC3D3